MRYKAVMPESTFARIYQDLMVQMPSIHYIDLDYNDKIIVKKS